MNYSGIYKHYEGTDAQCSGVQVPRELTWTTDLYSGCGRYLDCSGNGHYLISRTYVDNTYTPLSRSVTAGSGLAGGGALTSNITLNVGEGTGISVAADSISTNDSEIVHDNLSGVVTNEHINHGSVSIIAGSGLAGGGDITSSKTLNMDHLGFQTLADPGADRIAFWDNSEKTFDWLSLGTNLSISGTILSATTASGITGLTVGYLPYATSATTLGDSPLLTSGTDIFSDGWQDWSPLVSGWTTPTTRFRYKTIGDLVFVSYSIHGTGNEDGTLFTLPYSSEYSPTATSRVGTFGYDPGADPTGIISFIAVSGAYAIPCIDTELINAGGPIVASGYPKWLCGQFWYQKA